MAFRRLNPTFDGPFPHDYLTEEYRVPSPWVARVVFQGEVILATPRFLELEPNPLEFVGPALLVPPYMEWAVKDGWAVYEVAEADGDRRWLKPILVNGHTGADHLGHGNGWDGVQEFEIIELE